MIFVWVLLVSLCDPGMKACDSERLTTFRTSKACESYAGLMKKEMAKRGHAGDANCFDEPAPNPVKDSRGIPYEPDGRDT
jgi:hypothetical protein